MAISFEKTNYEGSLPVFWRGECEVLPAGFKPKNNIATGELIKRGHPLFVDFGTLEAAVVKAAVVVSGGTTSAPRLNKGNHFVVGDVVMKSGATTGVTISAIDTTNANYDVLTLSSAITGLTANDIIVEASATGSSATEKYVPNAVAAADVVINKNGATLIDAAWGARVLYDKVDYPVVSTWIQGICLKDNPNILFIRQ